MTATGNNHINALEMSSTTSTSKTNKMPADKKTTKKTEAVAVPVVVPAPAPAPVKESKPKVPKVPKSPAAARALAEIVVPTTTTPTVVVHQSSDALLTTLTEQLRSLSSEFSAKVREAVKATQAAAAQAKREARDSKKKRKVDPATLTPEQRVVWEARRANNAFLKQKPISDELCHFMGLPAKSKRSQTEVTKFVSEYVKSHSCYDPTFKRRIIPNAVLAKLLRVDDKTEVTYLNLQKFLKVHFIKNLVE